MALFLFNEHSDEDTGLSGISVYLKLTHGFLFYPRASLSLLQY